jgi:hypothetical protein
MNETSIIIKTLNLNGPPGKIIPFTGNESDFFKAFKQRYDDEKEVSWKTLIQQKYGLSQDIIKKYVDATYIAATTQTEKNKALIDVREIIKEIKDSIQNEKAEEQEQQKINKDWPTDWTINHGLSCHQKLNPTWKGDEQETRFKEAVKSALNGSQNPDILLCQEFGAMENQDLIKDKIDKKYTIADFHSPPGREPNELYAYKDKIIFLNIYKVKKYLVF